MAHELSLVLSGSKEFVGSLAGHLRARLGTSPRVATDARQVLHACAEDGGLLVMEYAGPDGMALVRNLRDLCGEADLSIVAAVPRSRLGELDGLQRAGVDEAVCWEGEVDPIMSAVSRVVAARPEPGTGPGGEGGRDREVTSAMVLGAAPALPGPSAPWPAGVPGSRDAERIAVEIANGTSDVAPALRGVTERVARSLSDLELAALRGETVPGDAAALRRAAGLRWRVAVALDTAPPAGRPVDAGAASSMLAEIDASLAEITALSKSVPVSARRALKAVRSALVKEAIDLTEALERIAPQGEEVTSTSALAKSLEALSPEASPAPAQERAAEEPPRRARLWIALGLAVAAGAAYHGHGLLTRPRPFERPTLPGAPPGTTVSGDARRTFVSAQPGRELGAAEIEEFVRHQRALGNAVKRVGPGTFIVTPEAAAGSPARSEGKAP